MIRLKVVGRREEPMNVAINGMAPGAPQQTEQKTISMVLFQSVDEEGNTISHPNAQTVAVPAASFDDLSDLTTGTIYELHEV